MLHSMIEDMAKVLRGDMGSDDHEGRHGVRRHGERRRGGSEECPWVGGEQDSTEHTVGSREGSC